MVTTLLQDWKWKMYVEVDEDSDDEEEEEHKVMTCIKHVAFAPQQSQQDAIKVTQVSTQYGMVKTKFRQIMHVKHQRSSSECSVNHLLSCFIWWP